MRLPLPPRPPSPLSVMRKIYYNRFPLNESCHSWRTSQTDTLLHISGWLTSITMELAPHCAEVETHVRYSSVVFVLRLSLKRREKASPSQRLPWRMSITWKPRGIFNHTDRLSPGILPTHFALYSIYKHNAWDLKQDAQRGVGVVLRGWFRGGSGGRQAHQWG